MDEPVRIEVWSDIACPWCLLGSAHLQKALERSGIKAEVTMRSYQLAPDLRAPQPVKEYLATKFGSAERVAESHGRLATMGSAVGLCYDFDSAVVANTFDAHRLHHFAKAQGCGTQVMDGLLLAQHTEGLDVSDHDVLRRIALEAELDADAVDDLLATDAYADNVRADIAEARAIGVQGVPFFVFDQRFAVSGAQPVEVFLRALHKAQTDAAG